MKKVLITGGAGFIGYHLAKRLLKDTEVGLVLADNFFRGKNDADFRDLLKDPRIKFLELDLTKESSAALLGDGYDYVYHLAGVNGTRLFYSMPEEVLRINTLSLVHVLEWFKNKNREGRFLYTSSCEAYSGALTAFGKLVLPTPDRVPLVVADPYNPRSSYETTKLLGEPFVIHYSKAYDFWAVIVRPHNFYGPRAGFEHVVPEFALRIRDKIDPFPIYGAHDTRSFCYIDDGVEAVVALMESKNAEQYRTETFNLDSAEEMKILDLAERMFKVANWRPKNLDIKDSPQGSVKRRAGDSTRLRQFTGWGPRVSLDDGLARTIQWYWNTGEVKEI